MILWFFGIVQVFAWQISGPERGHVLDADVGTHEVLVTTRVGVMRSDLQLSNWERDPRFPPETKRVAVWDKGAWAAPPTQLWEILEDDSMKLIKEFPNSVIVDLDARDDGVVFLGVRGARKGLWRIEPGGAAVELSSQLEPWKILVDGRDVWVGTLGQGLWSSEEGQPFAQVSTGSVTAIERVGSRVWVGYSSGLIVDAHTQVVEAQIEDGFATRIGALGPERAFLTVASPQRKSHPFQLLESGQLSNIEKIAVDEDSGYVGGTGVWSLKDGTAMVGTFRRGPLRWDGELKPARQGFQAMVSKGAAIDNHGQLVMAFMGTGVYRWKEGVIYPHDSDGPVTDSMIVRSALGEVVVLDFEGIKILNEDGSWRIMRGEEDPKQRIRNMFRDIGRTEDGLWWALDARGRLWSKQEEQDWTSCFMRQGLRLDGDGAALQVVTTQGYFHPSCTAQEFAQLRGVNVKESRSWGAWFAGNGTLQFMQQKIAEIPEGKVDALVKDGDGVLLSVREEPLLFCKTECIEVAPAVPEPLIALGRLSDGRIWALEESGSLLIDDETDEIPHVWHPFTERRVWFNSVMGLYSDPWVTGKAKFDAPKFLRSKQYRFDDWYLFFFIASVLSLILIWVNRKKT